MKPPITCLMGVFLVLGGSAHATSFGRKASADVSSIGGKPAICMPPEEKQAFRVGWVSIAESYIDNPGSWGVSLRDGAAPMLLPPGDCVVYGSVPQGYELDDHRINSRPLKLEVNKTYVFRLSDAYRPKDSYSVVFCISEAANGTWKYLQYIQLAEGLEFVPACDARRNANVPLLNMKRDAGAGV